MNTYIVDNESLIYNIELLKQKAGKTPIWAVLKGDGYGLGLLPLVKLLAVHGIDRFCVTEVHEAETLRKNGFESSQILMLRSVENADEISRLIDMNVILTVGSISAAALIDELAAQRSVSAEIHIKIDTGMGRYGFLPENTDDVLQVYRNAEHIKISGIYTHFDCALTCARRTKTEFNTFMNTVAKIRAAGYETGTVHCCGSAAFLRFPDMHCDGVRLGSAILGRMTFRTELRPVGYAESQIDTVRLLPKGHTAGYGAIWKAKKNTRIAIIPIGRFNGLGVTSQSGVTRFCDCLRLIFSGMYRILRRKKIYVEIGGRLCPVVGQIGMLHTAVDVSNVNCRPGDIAKVPIKPLYLKGMNIVYR